MTRLPFGKLVPNEAYASSYADGGGFEAACIAARQGDNAAFLRKERPRSILEVGCGPQLLCEMPGLRDIGFANWTIVEPASAYVDGAKKATVDDPRFHVVAGYLEASGDVLRGLAPEGFAAAIVSGVVHETTDAATLLRNVGKQLAPGGKVLVSTPNALSFHRLLAFESGMIDSPYALSALDVRFGHPRVFDPSSLAALLEEAGFIHLESGGSLFKPFTNVQLEKIVEEIGPRLVEGLIALGRRFPDQAAEIFVIGQKP